MSIPINFNDRKRQIGEALLSYAPLNGFELLEKIRKYDFNTHREPVVINFSNRLFRKVVVKGIIEDIEVNPLNYPIKPNGFNVLIITFKGDRLTKLTDQQEEDFQIPGSEVMVKGNNVYTKVILVDGPSMKSFLDVPNAIGRINSIGSVSAYERATVKGIV